MAIPTPEVEGRILSVFPADSPHLKGILSYVEEFVHSYYGNQTAVVNILYGNDKDCLAQYESQTCAAKTSYRFALNAEEVFEAVSSPKTRYAVFNGQFFGMHFWLRLLREPRSWNKIILVFWGADLEALIQYRLAANLTLRSRVSAFAHGFRIPRLLRRIRLVGVLMPQDGTLLTRHVAKLRNVCRLPYPFIEPSLDPAVILEEPRRYRIICGNSGNSNNNHFEIIDVAAKIIQKSAEWVFPLSYGNIEHIATVCGYGHCILGKAFTPIRQTMPYADYVRMYTQSHALIFNHTFQQRSQQGLGNICIAMSLGKKIYLRSDNPLFHQLNEWGAVLQDTLKLINGSDKDFFVPMQNRDAETNRQVLKDYFSKQACLKLWTGEFNRRGMSE